LDEPERGYKQPVTKKPAKGNSFRAWITARKLVQYAALFAFFLFFLVSKQRSWPADLANLPMRLDPLLMLAHLLASRTLLLGSSLALLAILLTLVFGRAWCGWICPLGTVLDLFLLKRWRGKRPPPPNPGAKSSIACYWSPWPRPPWAI
jgi:polyferredoxin